MVGQLRGHCAVGEGVPCSDQGGDSTGLEKWQTQSTSFGEKKFIYSFWLCWVFVAACGLSLVVALGLLLLRSTGSWQAGFSSCSRGAQQLRFTSLVAPGHVRSSQTRD